MESEHAPRYPALSHEPDRTASSPTTTVTTSWREISQLLDYGHFVGYLKFVGRYSMPGDTSTGPPSTNVGEARTRAGEHRKESIGICWRVRWCSLTDICFAPATYFYTIFNIVMLFTCFG